MTWHGLDVRDAEGMRLAARFVSDPAGIAISIDDANARYPVRIDPTFTDSDWFRIGQYPGVYGGITVMATHGSSLIVAGSLVQAGNVAGTLHIARWDGSVWSALGGGLEGDIVALETVGTDLYAGGTITVAPGVTTAFVKRWDGVAWTALATPVGNVTALANVSGVLHAAVATLNGPWVEKWTGSTWEAVGGGFTGGINAMLVHGGELHVGGSFTGLAMDPVGIAKWNGAAWVPVGTGGAAEVNALTVVGGVLYAGGNFYHATSPNILKLNGSAWEGMGSGLDRPVLALGSNAGVLYAGGEETRYAVVRGRVKHWNGSAWIDTGTEKLDGSVLALASYGGELIAGGLFSGPGDGVGGPDYRNLGCIARLNANVWSVVGNGLNGKVQAIAAIGSDVYVGGDFTAAGGLTIPGIARWNGTTWSALGSGLGRGTTVSARVSTLLVQGGNLYVGGEFATAGGITAPGIACWNGTTWSALGAGLNGSVLTLHAANGLIYAGGGALSAQSPSGFVASWDGATWTPIGAGFSNSVWCLTYFQGALHAGGQFTAEDAHAVVRLGRWNGTAWATFGNGITSGFPRAMAEYAGSLHVAGDFTIAGFSLVNRLGRWNGTAWSSLSGGFNGPVEDLLVRGGDLYAIGFFTTAGGIPARNIACWNGSAWHALGSGSSSGLALAASSSDLYVGGYPYAYYSEFAHPFARAHLRAMPSVPVDTDGAANTALENSAVGSATGLVVAASDPDVEAVTYTLDTTAGGRFAINAASGVVTVNGALNYESATSHTIRVRVSDGVNSVTQEFTIAVGNVDEPPSTPVDSDAAADQVVDGASAGTPVGITATASDPEGAAVVFDLTDDAGGRFAITTTTGVVTVVGGISHASATSHAITVRATAVGLSASTILVVTVLAPPTPPVIAPAPSGGGGGGCGLGSGIAGLLSVLLLCWRGRKS